MQRSWLRRGSARLGGGCESSVYVVIAGRGDSSTQLGSNKSSLNVGWLAGGAAVDLACSPSPV
jgi:hypothetical protein